jgi:fatty acid desaturase
MVAPRSAARREDEGLLTASGAWSTVWSEQVTHADEVAFTAPAARLGLTKGMLKEISAIHLPSSLLRLTVYTSLLLGCWALLAFAKSWWLSAPAMLCLGVTYAHGLELQHQCLHRKLVPGSRWSRAVGFALGAPMLVSYTHYRTLHLHHHKHLGTSEDAEIFDYDQGSLRSWPRLVARAWNLARLPMFGRTLLRALRGKFSPQFSTPELRRQLLTEYLALASLLGVAVSLSVALHSSLVIRGWFVPWLCVGELAHFLIELPEHLGCNKAVRNIMANTRSVRAPLFLQYITNRNNFHVEHHLYPGVSPRHLHRLHELLEPHLLHCSTYGEFYGQVLRQVGQREAEPEVAS